MQYFRGFKRLYCIPLKIWYSYCKNLIIERKTVMKSKMKKMSQSKQAPAVQPNQKSGNGFIQKAAGL